MTDQKGVKLTADPLDGLQRASRRPGPPLSRGSGDTRSGMLILLLLLALLGVLTYLYLIIATPPRALSKPNVNGLQHVFSIYGWGKERLNSPNAVAVDNQGNILVTDTENHRVVAFDDNGAYRFHIGNPQTTIHQLAKSARHLFYPLGVAVGENGNIFVVSMERSMLQIFDSRGRFKKAVPLDRPITVKAVGNQLYITTPGQVWVTDLAGRVLRQFGNRGRALGQLAYPNGLAVDKRGWVFVSDSENNRIQIFDPRGEAKYYLGEPTKSINQSRRLFGLGMGMTLDDKENVYVADAFAHSVRIFSKKGDELGEVGDQGDDDGLFNYPSGIAYIGGRRFAIADKWNDRVQVVEIFPPGTAPGLLGRVSRINLSLVVALATLIFLILAALTYLSLRRRARPLLA